jgi:hypothetical protein
MFPVKRERAITILFINLKRNLKEAIKGEHGREMMGSPLIVEFAKGKS